MDRRGFVKVGLGFLGFGLVPKVYKPVITYEDGWKVIRGDLFLDRTLYIYSGEKVHIIGNIHSTARPYAIYLEHGAHLKFSGICELV